MNGISLSDRCIYNTYRRKCSLSDIIQLVKFLLSVVEWSHASLYSPSYSSGNQRCAAESEIKIPRDYSLWEVQTIAFPMIGDIFSSFGTSFQVDTWQSTIEVVLKFFQWVYNLPFESIIDLFIFCELGP